MATRKTSTRGTTRKSDAAYVEKAVKQSASDAASPGLTLYDGGGALGIRPVAANSLNIVATYMNNRPIVSTGLAVAETYFNGRPIEARNREVVGTFMNNRPVMGSTQTIVAMYMGNRPIMSSGLNVVATYAPSGLKGIVEAA